MELFMKKTFLLAVVTLFIFSCSEDEVSNDQNLEEASLSLSQKDKVVDVPSGLETSDNIYAAQVNTWVQMANSIQNGYLGYFEVPDGATKSSEPIVAANSRANLTTGEYLVYKWTDPGSGYGLAYQVSQEADKYIFQIFFKFSDDPNWYKYIEAEEQKDESSGSFKIYGALGQSSSSVYLKYEWTYNDGMFNFNIYNNTSSFEIDMVVNEETGAGEVKYYSSGQLDSFMSWDAKGNGSWKIYDDAGDLDDQGSWTV